MLITKKLPTDINKVPCTLTEFGTSRSEGRLKVLELIREGKIAHTAKETFKRVSDGAGGTERIYRTEYTLENVLFQCGTFVEKFVIERPY